MRLFDSFLRIGTTLLFFQPSAKTLSFIKDLEVSFNGKDIELPQALIILIDN